MKILVVGKGGREHALLRAFADSPSKPELFCHPGSDAIAEIATRVDATDLPTLVDWMTRHSIDLCVAGEESCLVEGIGLTNLCQSSGIPCWGPPKETARLEASKQFAKEFMLRHGIPTGSSTLVSSVEEGMAAIGGHYPTVLKFDGLAAGKGVAVCQNASEAKEFLEEVFEKRRFGDGRVLVEEFLEGPELSLIATVVDGRALPLVPARDYKRALDGDRGSNTGGMGAVASRDLVDAETLSRIEREIVRPTVNGLVSDGLPYRGFLYFGLMLTPDGPKVIEYNCRFGDPECQAVMPLLRGDLAAFCLDGAMGRFNADRISFAHGWSVCVVLASAGYPATSRNGDPISGLDGLTGVVVIHSGTRRGPDGRWETCGGRVLAVVATGSTRDSAVAAAHAAADRIRFDGLQRRRDIGILHFDSVNP